MDYLNAFLSGENAPQNPQIPKGDYLQNLQNHVILKSEGGSVGFVGGLNHTYSESEPVSNSGNVYSEAPTKPTKPTGRVIPESLPAATATESPPLFSWEELAAQRWGPARDDPTPGIEVDQLDLAIRRAALEGADHSDPYALAERESLQEESREAELDARIAAQIANEPIPADPAVWRRMVATWSIAKRQAWADRAEAHQVAGVGWKEAEWLAFEATAGEGGYPPDVRLREPAPASSGDVRPRVTPDLVPFPEFEDLPGREDLEHAKNWNQCVDPRLTSPAPADGSLTPSTSAGRRWRCGNRYCFHKERWWMSTHGVVLCTNCKPPGRPELVVADGDASNAPAVEPDCSRQAVDYPRSIPATTGEPDSDSEHPR